LQLHPHIHDPLCLREKLANLVLLLATSVVVERYASLAKPCLDVGRINDPKFRHVTRISVVHKAVWQGLTAIVDSVPRVQAGRWMATGRCMTSGVAMDMVVSGRDLIASSLLAALGKRLR
jgi:hypothetical protein